jgi:hypothetical protein
MSTAESFCAQLPSANRLRLESPGSLSFSFVKDESRNSTQISSMDHSGPCWTPYGRVGLVHQDPPPEDTRRRRRKKASSDSNNVRAWRECVGFAVPVLYPELNSYDPDVVHSAVLRMTRDSGVQFVSCNSDQTPAVCRNVEHGVVGVSLQKHSEAFLRSTVDTFPGFVQRSKPRRRL